MCEIDRSQLSLHDRALRFNEEFASHPAVSEPHWAEHLKSYEPVRTATNSIMRSLDLFQSLRCSADDRLAVRGSVFASCLRVKIHPQACADSSVRELEPNSRAFCGVNLVA
jgi:hypothetical protein